MEKYLDNKIKELEELLYRDSLSTYGSGLLDAYKDLKEQLALCNVVDTLPADELIKSLGEATETNEYILKVHNGVWWIEHKHVGSGEPLKQWLTDKPISAVFSVVRRSEQLPNMTLEQAIAKAKPNLDKITDVDKHLDDIR